MPKINYTRPEVIKQSSKWAKIRDCIAGQETVKEKNTVYLPMPNAADTSAANKARYAAYLLRAVFYNVVDNTLRGLIGQVFSADPVIDLPDDMEALISDADGNGVSLNQVAKKALSETLGFGRCGLFVDFPKLPDGATSFSRLQIQSGEARPVICEYAPEQIINWRTRLIDNKSVLSMVVIEKNYIAQDDGFEIQTANEWLVLYLDQANLYVYEIWRENENVAMRTTEPFILADQQKPQNNTGARLGFIPFTFIGSLNNNEFPDKPPLYDLAELNLAHYRNSADYEDSVYMVGQPTPIFTGLTANWVSEVLKDTVQLGSRAAVPLPVGADAKMLVAEENGLVKEAMEIKERQMVALGAQLVQQKEVQRTLGEAQIERATVSSTLVQCAKNTGDGILKALKWAALFYGVEDSTIDFQLSTDFAISKMSPDERAATIADYQGGAISWTELRYQYRQSGLAYLEDEKAKSEIAKDQAEAVNMDQTDTTTDDNGNANPSGE